MVEFSGIKSAARILAVPLSSWVTLGNLLCLSVFCLICKNRDNDSISLKELLGKLIKLIYIKCLEQYWKTLVLLVQKPSIGLIGSHSY